MNQRQTQTIRQLTQYLQNNDISLTAQINSQFAEQLIALLKEKQKTISALDGQLTKAKAQQIKNTKLISTLQDKITELCPNTNNTGSSFMMPSQFRDHFQEFIKNDFVNIMSPLLSTPKSYVRYGKELLLSIYRKMKQKIEDKIQKICQILNIKGNQQEVKQKIQMNLLKILQDNWESVFDPFEAVKLQYENSEIRQIQENDQFQEVQRQFTKLCAYMLLQQKEWELILPQNKIQPYVKKQYSCIDGWIKQKKPVIFMIEGLKKGQNRHQNLKNYVIPFVEDEDELVFVKNEEKTESIKEKENFIIQISPQQQKKESSLRESQNISVKAYTEIQPIMIKKQNTFLNSHEASINLIEKYCKNEREKSKSRSRSFNKSGKNSKHEDNFYETKPLQVHDKKAHKNIEIDCSKYLMQRDASLRQNKKLKKDKGKSRHGLISDPSFDEIIQFPTKLRKDELPLKRESKELKVKKNNNSSRKGSVGKIIGQTIEHKENINPKSNKQQNYKQIIKQKMLDEPKKTKTQRIYDKNKEEDRPLRATHMKKIRQKYLNR